MNDNSNIFRYCNHLMGKTFQLIRKLSICVENCALARAVNLHSYWDIVWLSIGRWEQYALDWRDLCPCHKQHQMVCMSVLWPIHYTLFSGFKSKCVCVCVFYLENYFTKPRIQYGTKSKIVCVYLPGSRSNVQNIRNDLKSTEIVPIGLAV